MRKLDRNVAGLGPKFAAISLRKLPERPRDAQHLLAMLAEHPDAIQLSEPGGAEEFFLIKLKDRYSQKALMAYSDEAWADGQREYADDINELAKRSGPNHPNCKTPD